MLYEWYTVSHEMRATQHFITRMPYQTLHQIYIAVEELSRWWDEHHRDDEGHQKGEWINIEGEARCRYFN